MLEILNEMIRVTPYGQVNLEVIRSHVKPELIAAWEDRFEKPSIYGIEIRGSEIHVNNSFHIECGDRQQAEKFLLYLLALSSEDVRINKQTPPASYATISKTESREAADNNTTNQRTPYYQGGWRKKH